MLNEYMLIMEKITKSFPGVRALSNVDLKVKKGEVHALMGENGAGKSTLMKILMGIYKHDDGEITFNGKKLEVLRPRDALNAGISMIHQELSPLPDMSIAENLFLGRELSNCLFLSKKKMIRQSDDIIKQHGMKDIKSAMLMKNLSVAKMQMIEIIKASLYKSKLIVMDEPTSSLSNDEVIDLFKLIGVLKNEGVSIIYITHRMEEVFKLADSATVLRDGETVGYDSIKNIDEQKLIKMMIGRELNHIFPKEKSNIGDIAFEVKNLTRNGVFDNVSFNVKRGEILGIAGLVGSGRSEIVRAIFGIDKIDSGEIYIDKKKISIKKPIDAIKNGIALVTEDRKELGLVLCRSIIDNINLPNLDMISKTEFVKRKKEKYISNDVAQSLSIKMSSILQIVENLSGGNQQKVVIAKCLIRKPKIFILDEPTRGIDVGSKSEIHRLMSNLACEGMAVIMISSEMPEILGMSDRIIVVGEGKIKGEFSRKDATQESILTMALK